MNTSKHSVPGIILFAEAFRMAWSIQLLRPSLITARSLPVHHRFPGRPVPTEHHSGYRPLPLLPLAFIASVGLVCPFLPRRHDHAA